ncbi:MAG: nicotinate phosphoribosyltransferase [Gammaproteobacteria bacterium]|nr:nicotinate phosphoribosyltransferase [Gammaproteobacteria bacterium]
MHKAADALLTDLYQLTMLAGYFAQRMHAPAVFELYVRALPPGRNFLVAAGLEQALAYLEALRFTADEIQWLRATGRFGADFLDWLARLRFSGDVDAMPEGTMFFPDEPILRVVAPMPQAQLVESRLINIVHFQTLIASKAVRCRLAAPAQLLVDFGMRRAHGAEAALYAARATYLAGFDGTATVLAGMRYGMPVFGTMAHSFIQAHDDESLAFEHFAGAQPDNVVFLIDTYDTEAGARRVVELAPRLAARGIRIKGVRLDSGDLAAHARQVRTILDAGGCREVTIFASSGLDEAGIAHLLGAGAPIDGFGVGTAVDTSADRPYLDCVYKLQEYAGVARRKRSEGKATWPGRKQIFRRHDRDGVMCGDVLTVVGAPVAGATPLLQPAMRAGRRLDVPEPLARIRTRVADGLRQLPAALRTLEPAPVYAVQVSAALRALADEVDRRNPTPV